MLMWAKKHPRMLLFFLVAIIFFSADGWHVINYPPTSIHQWRQSDCVAYSRNYFTRHSGFLSPSFYNLVVDGGRSVSELPIFYYIAAKLYAVLGFHYWILRALTFLCFIAGLFWFYKCIRFWIDDSLIALFPVVLLASTPYYYYYGLNVLPNVPAIALSFGGLYYLLRFQRAGGAGSLLASTLLFILSVLIKPTDGGVIWLAYLCVCGKMMVFDHWRDRKIGYIILSSVVIAGALMGWVRYVNWYNAANHNDLNLIGIYPFWDMSKIDIIYTLRWRMGGVWASSYQDISVLCLLACLLVVYVVKWRAMHAFLKFFTLFLLLGCLAYSVLWFRAFSDLDYYQLINVIAPAFLIVTVLEFYVSKVVRRMNTTGRYVVALSLIVLSSISIIHNRDVQHVRYTDPALTYKARDFYEIEPFARQMGVQPGDTVISIPDLTPNATLLAIGNPGYTSFYGDDGITLSHFKNHGARFLFVNDSNLLHHPLYMPFLTKPIGKFHDVYLYDLR